MSYLLVEEAADWLSVIKSEAVKKIIEKLINSISESGGDKLFVKWVQELDLQTFFIAEVLLIVLMMIVRSYIFSKCKSFWSHLLGEVWTFAVYLSLSLFFIPMILFGSKYFELIKLLFKYVN